MRINEPIRVTEPDGSVWVDAESYDSTVRIRDEWAAEYAKARDDRERFRAALEDILHEACMEEVDPDDSREAIIRKARATLWFHSKAPLERQCGACGRIIPVGGSDDCGVEHTSVVREPPAVCPNGCYYLPYGDLARMPGCLIHPLK